MSTTDGPATDLAQLLTAMLNMTAFHREHEKFYSTAPREQAVVLQRHSRTLHALADQWTTTTPSTVAPDHRQQLAGRIDDERRRPHPPSSR